MFERAKDWVQERVEEMRKIGEELGVRKKDWRRDIPTWAEDQERLRQEMLKDPIVPGNARERWGWEPKTIYDQERERAVTRMAAERAAERGRQDCVGQEEARTKVLRDILRRTEVVKERNRDMDLER